jgi:hypothetical protein
MSGAVGRAELKALLFRSARKQIVVAAVVDEAERFGVGADNFHGRLPSA